MNKRVSEGIWGYAFILPQLTGLLIFAFIPLVSAFVLSLMKWDGFGKKQFIGLDNFVTQFHNPDFKLALFNTAWYTLLVVPTGIVLAILVAVALNKVRGKVVYRLFYYMPVVTSSIAVSIVWLWLLNSEFGIINVYLKQWFGIVGPEWLTNRKLVIPSIAMLSVWWGLGGNMVLFLAGLQGISSSYYEAAQIDGASRFRQFWHITLPLLSPTTFFATIMSIIGSFQVFDQSFVMTGGGPAKASYTIVYHIYQLAFVEFTFGKSAAAAVILFGIILTLTLLQMYMSKRWVHYGG
ncbi:sugar ABC transporter permease [Paenibacillus doosanensis]|uniref:Sn-glycerol-3-phosphate transport system permease protein UgpA n=1 Tax=Paenibacillus konkukensis TaxID=2020716 RepID=A0ABY4RZ31_9BACL|nr:MULTISPECIES: sugar ABC transporter permease [Paenibacillus]MCS7458587.1 sugar ABC transporter permease [Paenibacillus doosanensis]UQZ86891.1 sn-glycerol-3-phosphate transport system permease protein UgpA [Paenibacillus konkukensis]